MEVLFVFVCTLRAVCVCGCALFFKTEGYRNSRFCGNVENNLFKVVFSLGGKF